MTVDERLDRIERQNFYLRVGLVLVLLAAVEVLVMGQAAPSGTTNEVRAREFVLVDANGVGRARLGLVHGKDIVTLTISDAQGNSRVWLEVKDSRPSLSFWGDNDKLPMTLGLNREGRPYLSLVDDQTKERLSISLGRDGSPDMTLADKNEKTRLSVGLGRDGTPDITLADENEKTRLSAKVWPDGSPGITLFDENTKSRLSVGMLVPHELPCISLLDKDQAVQLAIGVMRTGDGAEHPGVLLLDKQRNTRAALVTDDVARPELYDDGNRTRAVLGGTDLQSTRTGVVEQRPESSLVLFDKDGKVIWRAP